MGMPRRTDITDEGGYDMEDEDLIPVEDIVITMSTSGYIKRAPVDTYTYAESRWQRRQGHDAE